MFNWSYSIGFEYIVNFSDVYLTYKNVRIRFSKFTFKGLIQDKKFHPQNVQNRKKDLHVAFEIPQN